MCSMVGDLTMAAAWGARGATDPLKIKERGSDPLKIQQCHSHFLQFIRGIRSW